MQQNLHLRCHCYYQCYASVNFPSMNLDPPTEMQQLLARNMYKPRQFLSPLSAVWRLAVPDLNVKEP